MRGLWMLTLPIAVLSTSAAVPSSPQAPLEVGMVENSIVVDEPDRPVIINAPDLATIEPYLVANPRDARHLLAGVFLIRNFGDPRKSDQPRDMVCSALTSFDAGATWLRHDFPDPSCFDPWVAILPGGEALFVGLGKPGAPPV